MNIRRDPLHVTGCGKRDTSIDPRLKPKIDRMADELALQLMAQGIGLDEFEDALSRDAVGLAEWVRRIPSYVPTSTVSLAPMPAHLNRHQH